MRKTAVLVGLLLSFLILHPHIIAAQPTADTSDAQSTTDTSMCEYKGKWDEPKKFQKPSINIEQMRQCLYDEKTIKNQRLIDL